MTPPFEMWHVHQYLVLLIGLLVVVFKSFSIATRLQTLLWFYVLASATAVAFCPFNDFNYVNPHLALQFPGSAAQTAFIALLLPLAVWRSNNLWLKNLFKSVAVIESIMLLGFDRTLFYGTTFSSAYCLLSLLFFDPRKSKLDWLLIAPLVTCLVYAGSTTAFVALLMLPVLFKFYRNQFSVLIYTIALSALVYLKRDLLDSNGRLDMWSSYLDQWANHFPFFSGSGFGTWEWIGPFIYKAHDGMRFVWPHNDYLQVLFEGGVIGFALLLAVIVEALLKIRKRPKLFALGLGFLVFMFTYYPLHWTTTQVLALYLLKRSNDSKCNQEFS